MGFLWALGGILAGTLAAIVAGVILDYAQRLGWIVPIGEQWLLLPIVTGLAGFLGGLVSVLMYGRYLRSKGPVVRAKGQPAAASRTATPKGMEHVPGMPTFDVNALRSGSADAPPATGSRPAPPISTPPEQKQ